MQNLLTNINSSDAVSASGFLIGFSSQILSRPDAFERPLSAIVGACICGLFCRAGANFIDDTIFPSQYRFLYPVMATASIVFYMHRAFNR